MGNEFDPYYEWLGIPPKHQPANHYRLLGIDGNEADAEVIRHAAKQRLAYLRTLQTGPRGKAANQLLNEISRAQHTLLDPAQRQAYDATLQSPSQAAPPELPPHPNGSPARRLTDRERPNDSREQERKSSRRRGRTPTTRRGSVGHEQEEVTEADVVSQRGIKRMRIMAFVLVGLAVILFVFSLRSKPLMVRTYIDQNNNQRFDAGEEEAGVGIVKYFINEQHPAGGELDRFSWPTDASGIVNLTDIQGGKIGFAAENPYQVSGNQDKPYYEAMIDDGPRFFAQVVDIPVFRTIILRGKVTSGNSHRTRDAPRSYWFIDTDGNGVFLNGAERLIATDKRGRFEIVLPDREINEKTILRVMTRRFDDRFKKPSGIPLALGDVKNGVLELAIRLERKSINYQGRVRMKPENASPEGFVVYLDKNKNSRRDASERYCRTDRRGNFKIEGAWFENWRTPSILKVEVDLDRYEIPRPMGQGSLNAKLPSITIQNANFIIDKKKIRNKRLTDNLFTTDEKRGFDAGESTVHELRDSPEDNPVAFIQGLGFSGDLPEEGSEEKPAWSFQINDELISQFNTAKRAYDKAAKKQNWGKILELEAAKKHNDAKIKDILTNAKTEAAKTRAQQKVAPYNKANTNIDAELSPLKESRDALKGSLVMAAQAVEQQQQQYQAALDDTEGVKTAATALGVSIQPLTKKQRAAWQPAIEFLAERELVRLGLKKQGRKWIPVGVLQEAAMLPQIKQFAQQNFKEYVSKKQTIVALIGQNNPANQTQIDKLQQQLDFKTRAKNYRNAKKTFDNMTKTYLEQLSSLQSQREAMEGDKANIETALGGAKKLQAVLKQYPSAAEIEKKQEFIFKLQRAVE